MKKLCICFISLLFLTNCATISKETVESSMVLTQQIEALQRSHLGIVQTFFHTQEEDFKLYMNEVYLPKFLDQLFKEEYIASESIRAIKSGNVEHKIQFMQAVAHETQKEYKVRLQSFLTSLYKLRDQVIDLITSEYNKTLKLSRTITRNVSSASERSKVGTSLLNDILDDDKIKEMIDKGVEDIQILYPRISNK